MAAWAENDGGTASKGTRAVAPIPKPPGRDRASQSQWTILRRHFEFEPCCSCGGKPVTLHHICPRSQGGGDVVENLVPLCGDGTRGCHGLLESHGNGWERVAASVRQYVIVDNTRRHYQEDHAGESFNRRYPPLPNTDPEFERAFREIYPPLEYNEIYRCDDPEGLWISDQKEGA